MTIVLIFVLYSLIFDGSNEEKICVAGCINAHYYCISDGYEGELNYQFISEYNSKMCHWDLSNCEFRCYYD